MLYLYISFISLKQIHLVAIITRLFILLFNVKFSLSIFFVIMIPIVPLKFISRGFMSNTRYWFCQDNGYQLLFLSARAIVQAYLTRNFLVNLKQVLKPFSIFLCEKCNILAKSLLVWNMVFSSPNLHFANLFISKFSNPCFLTAQLSL